MTVTAEPIKVGTDDTKSERRLAFTLIAPAVLEFKLPLSVVVPV